MPIPQIIPESAIIVVLTIVAVVGLLSFVGYFGERVQRINLSFIQIFYTPLQQIARWCTDAIQAVMGWLRGQVIAESPDGTTTHLLYYVFGAIAYSAITALLIFCDLGLIVQTLDAMFGVSMDYVSEEPMQLMAWGLLATTAVWPALIFDALSVTHFAPWVGRLNQFWKRVIMGVCLFFLLVSLTSYLSIPYWRFDAERYNMVNSNEAALVLDAPVEIPDFGNLNQQFADLDSAATAPYKAPVWALFCIIFLSAFALIGGTIVSLTGAIPLLKWLFLAVVGLVIMPPLALLSFLMNMICGVFGLIHRLFEECLGLIIAFGQRIIALVGWQPEVLQEEKDQLLEGDRDEETRSVNESMYPEVNRVAAEEQDQEPIYRPASSGFDPFGHA